MAGFVRKVNSHWSLVNLVACLTTWTINVSQRRRWLTLPSKGWDFKERTW